MKKNNLLLYILYGLVLAGFCLYSYALIDPNITLFNHPLWSRFLETMLPLGYYERWTSWRLYLFLVIALFIFHYIFVRHYKAINPLKLALFISLLLLLAYPLLSHDLFNYMFDAKIFTYYGQNPYLHKALDFPQDQWIRFMHWTHRTYPYGPVFLIITIVTSFMGFGKFLLNFILFKALSSLFYLLSVYFLNKLNRRWAIIFATSPLIIIDSLINSHNDLISVAFLIIGIYFLFKNSIKGKLFFLLSAGIKFMTIPAIFLSKKNNILNKLIFSFFIIFPLILIIPFFGNLFHVEIQTWYFIVVLGFLPFYENIITKLNILFFGLLISYYPFIRFGLWDKYEGVPIKHIIIVIFALINLIAIIAIPKWRKSLTLNNS